MATIRWPLFARRTHKWLALFVGVQVLAWSVTGFYMVAVHIGHIHGNHLVRTAPVQTFDTRQLVSPARAIAEVGGAGEVRLHTFFDRPVWRVETAGLPALVDAVDGRRLPALTKAQVEEIARRIYTGDPTIVSTKLLTDAPLEMQSRKPPYWQVEFVGWNRPTLYISPTTGELLSRRHALWRVFDFAWMLHIMDYEERSNSNNTLLRVTTWLTVVMALSGAWLLLWSFPRKKKKKKA